MTATLVSEEIVWLNCHTVTFLGHVSYKERLQCLVLFSIEKRCLKGNMIEKYKILQGMDRVDREALLPLTEHQN